jgi:hypothetical protein
VWGWPGKQGRLFGQKAVDGFAVLGGACGQSLSLRF